MKTAIVYISKHGTTEKVAKMIQAKVGLNQATLFNLRLSQNPDIKDFDAVIIGGSIHAGMIQKRVTTFCKNNKEVILSKSVGLFLCGMYEGIEAEKQILLAYPEDLQKHAKFYEYVGGEFLFEKMNFFERILVKKIAGTGVSQSKINIEKVDKMISEFYSK